MNARDGMVLPDIQSQPDRRNLAIGGVGVKGVRYPIHISSGGSVTPTVATLAMTVGLPASVKGTHMSRFIELLEAQTDPFNRKTFIAMAHDMLARLHAESGTIEMQFPYFVKKTAPVSGVSSLLDVDVCWRASVTQDGQYTFRTKVVVAATSLCPCSKEISAYGAHNQRSHISIDAALNA
ncbi:MAG: GTP cyclohydrolase, FolE2/MptA family, partial [Herbaspirillum sp.]